MSQSAQPGGTNLTEHDREELRQLYDVSVGDIAFFKRQQWSATNYTLLIHAALVFVAYQVFEKTLTPGRMIALIILTWVVGISGFSVVSSLQSSIVGRRERLARVREHYGEVFNTAWRIPKEADYVDSLLRAVAIASAAVVTWLLLERL